MVLCVPFYGPEQTPTPFFLLFFFVYERYVNRKWDTTGYWLRNTFSIAPTSCYYLFFPYAKSKHSENECVIFQGKQGVRGAVHCTFQTKET